MAMSKKVYVAVAKSMWEARLRAARAKLTAAEYSAALTALDVAVDLLAETFNKDNERFNAEKFYAAAGFDADPNE